MRKRPPPAAPSWSISDSAWLSIPSGWTGSAISTGFCSKICRNFSVTDSMTTPQHSNFSKSSCNPRIRIRTLRPSTATVNIAVHAMTWISLPSIAGESLDRLFQYLIRVPSSAAPVRGLIRSATIRQAGLVKSDEFRAPLQVIVWLAKLVRSGNFRRVAKPLYYRLDHPHSFSNEFFNSPTDQKLAAWPTLFTGLLEAAIPFCRTPEERLFFQQIIVDRVVVFPIGNASPSSTFMAECLKRLRYEGQTHLLGVEELPAILNEAQHRLDEFKSSEQSRIASVFYRIRQRSQMARVMYPRSRMRRVIYQIRHLLEILKNKTRRLLLLPG